MNDDDSGFDLPEEFEVTRLGDVTGAPPERIGPYRLLRKLGEGGMGVVYEAEQERPVRRKVALKVIKLGMDTNQVIARFESERQALALMSHPNIARVYDAGATDQGRPFFAMEFIRGIPIDRYCKRNRLGTEERLSLFIHVCEGVQHAHQKGVIHRDLKPSNVLVSDEDGVRTPKIIDFGIAKAVEHRLTERSLFTELGQLVGTPEYMSPEQAEMSGLDIDTRTDVYLLGVLLYELLTGELPFSSGELRRVGFNEFRRKVLEEDPPRPSTRLTNPGNRSESARPPKASPVLSRQLKGDLDWITMKALEKDRTRRYASASELAADVRRYLSHEPVTAGPPSSLYRTRKFVRRHRGGVAFVAVLLVLLGGFAATMALQRREIARERDQKEVARASAVTEAAAAREVAGFLESLFEVSDPWETLGEEITAREILDRGARRIRNELEDQPLVQARLMRIIGRVYGNMSLFDDAEALLEEALRIQRRQAASSDLAVASTMQDLAGVVLADGDLDRSRTYYEQSLDIRVHELGLDHADVAESMNYVANVLNLLGHPERAAEYWDDAYAVWERQGDFYNMAKVQSNRGWLHLTAGDPGPAVPLFDEALELIARSEEADHPLIAVILDTRARAELALGNLGRARQDYERALGIRTAVYTEPNQTVAHLLLRVAMIDLREGRGAAAAERYRQALEILEQTESLDLPFIVYELASYAALAGDVEAALRDLRRAVVDHRIYATPRLLHDPNLDSLRSEPEFGAIVAEVRSRFPNP